MAGLREILWRVLAVLRRRRLEQEMRSELQVHLDMEVEAAMGMRCTRKQAERRARLRAGTITAAMEEVRDQYYPGWFNGMVMDLRHACTALRRRPGFALATTAALALAVAINTLTFTVVDGVILRPLPYPEPERLVRVFQWTERNPKFPLSILNYTEDCRASRTLEGIGLYTREDLQLMHGDRPERLTAVQITDDFLPTLGVRPMLGRNFTQSEMLRSARVAILSYRLWSSRFARDPEIVGKTIRLNRENWTIIGVLSAGLQHVGGVYRSPLQGDTVALWTPLGLDLEPNALRNWHFTNAIARLRPGMSARAAEEDLNRIMDDLARRFPNSYAGARARVEPLVAEVVGRSRGTIELLMAAGALVLCLACVNIAGLCVARTLARRRELAVRQALGGGSWRLVRTVLSENLVLGAAGGMFGLVLAACLFPALRFIIPADFPRLHEVELGASSALFAVVVALAAGLAAGLVPALRQTRIDPRRGLSDDPRASSVARDAQRLRAALVACELALACVLCFGALLLMRSSMALRDRDHGFEPGGVLTFRIALPGNAYRAPERITALYNELRRRWREIAGVRAAGLATNIPWSGYDENTSFDIVGRQPGPGESIQARFQAATPGFFEALRFRLLEGRFVEDRDSAAAPPVVVVNQALARRYFPQESVIGKYLDIWGAKRQIVGVVADVRDRPDDLLAEPAFWWPMAQLPFSQVQVVLRTDSDPLALVSAAGEVVRALDRELPIAEVMAMDDVAALALAERRFALGLFQVFASVAMALAAFGIYGLLAYMVQQRRKELGIRQALGATRTVIVSAIIRDGMRLALIGAGIGLALAPAAGRALSIMLYGVTATDTVTLLAAPLLILTVSLFAGLLPAWAASRAEPVSALRED